MTRIPTEPTEPTNFQCSIWAGDALHAYGSITGLVVADDAETTLTDLLCDLHHWADVHGIDWAEATAHGERHYNAEVGR